MKKGDKWIALLFVLFLFAAGVEVGSAADVGLSRIVGYVFFVLALILAALTFAYAFIFLRRIKKEREWKKDRVEEVIKILKEAKRIKEEIEKRENI